ncbi:MAG: O-methyltransferase, partial [Flavobacteriaceae bacterium]
YLKDLSRETHQKVIQPRMISGHYQGRLLSFLSNLVRPNRILELGTYTGYSALCLAEGLSERGTITTIEVNEELAWLQQKYWKLSPYHKKIRPIVGDALEVIPSLQDKYDLVFIDAKKADYNKYLETVIPKLNKGCLILSDNILWSGKVVEPLQKGDNATEALLKYNQRLTEDNRFEHLILPVRDGLSVARYIAY